MTLKLQMNPDEYLPLRDVVFNTLREAILKGELQPGERLMEIALANRLGVSRTPVREAIRKLELEGLVIMTPRKGAQVAKITEKDLNDVLEVRLGLEALVMELACQRIDEEHLKKIETYMHEFASRINDDDVTQMAEADVQFHEVIYDATNNRRLIQMISNLREQMYRYRVEYLKDLESRELIVEEHKEIYESMRDKDFKRAYESVKMHIQNQQAAIVKTLREEEAKAAEKENS